MASYKFYFMARKNGDDLDIQNLRWDHLSISAPGALRMDPTAIFFHILGGIGQGYTQADFTGPGGSLIAAGSGPYDVINHPPATPWPVTAEDIIAVQAFGVATGMMVLEDDDYVEFGAVDTGPAPVHVQSLKLVRVGIGNFL